MNEETLSPVQLLRPGHDLAGFGCGRPELDHWLRTYALESQQRDIARTFVVCRGKHRVVGFYSLTMGAVRVAEAPKRLVRGLPNYPIGMVLLARLAIDRKEQGTGLGTELLADALLRALHAGETAAAQLIVVDALNDRAAGFCARFGFSPAPERPHRLFLQLKDIRTSLARSPED